MIRAGLRGMSGAGLLVVGTLCGALALVVLTACIFALLHPDRDLPEYLGQLLLTLTPLVAGLLAKTYADSRGAGEPAPVEVVNNASSPVPTAETEVATDVRTEDVRADPVGRRRR